MTAILTPGIKPRAEDSFAISFAPLSIEEIYAKADAQSNGAVVMMSGTVRNQTDGQPVVALEYQAYEPMALRVFYQIAAEIRSVWPDANRVVIHHRTGHLQVGEISVLVAVGCPHRHEAFAACRYAIDTLKHNAPIWKKEHWADGSSSWVSIGACEQSGKVVKISQAMAYTRISLMDEEDAAGEKQRFFEETKTAFLTELYSAIF